MTFQLDDVDFANLSTKELLIAAVRYDIDHDQAHGEPNPYRDFFATKMEKEQLAFLERVKAFNQEVETEANGMRTLSGAELKKERFRLFNLGTEAPLVMLHAVQKEEYRRNEVAE